MSCQRCRVSVSRSQRSSRKSHGSFPLTRRQVTVTDDRQCRCYHHRQQSSAAAAAASEVTATQTENSSSNKRVVGLNVLSGISGTVEAMRAVSRRGVRSKVGPGRQRNFPVVLGSGHDLLLEQQLSRRHDLSGRTEFAARIENG